MTLTLAGLGTAVPAHCTTQDDALQMTMDTMCRDERQRRLTQILFRRSAVRQRHTVVAHPIPSSDPVTAGEPNHGPSTRERMQLYIDHAPKLALDAARSALEDAGVSREGISHLVTVSCTGFDAPGVDLTLITELGLHPSTQRVHIGYMGCHGAINGLRTANGLAAAESEACVLMCAVECCSLHYRFTWDDEGSIGNALFADGAAAIVGSLATDRTANWTLSRTGSCLLGHSRSAMSWQIGNHGFEMRLTREVPELIEQTLKPWLADWLGQVDLSLDDIRSFAIHPGGPRILEAVESALRLSRTQTAVAWDVLAEYGNMSSPTVLFIVDRLRQQDADRPCLALAFGPGLIVEAALFV